LLEAALFDTGRPTLIVPYIQKEGFSAKRVLCCWDGSRAAARAMGDALPILQKASSVKVLTISTGKFNERDVTGAELATHLSRHKLQVELVRISGGRHRCCKRDPVACRRQWGRPDRDGRLRSFPHARACAWRRDARHVAVDDRADADVTLIRSRLPDIVTANGTPDYLFAFLCISRMSAPDFRPFPGARSCRATECKGVGMPFSFGIEEEYFLVDRESKSVARRMPDGFP
jgi:hypothetical protein